MERLFWKRWLGSRGGHCPEMFERELNPSAPWHPHLSKYLDCVPTESVDVLDVGSGPMTVLGKVHPGKSIRITATDYLARDYHKYLADNAIKPLVKTIFADAENLRDIFDVNAFDFVHANNCIDHTSDPMRAIDQMLSVVRPERYVFMRHRTNEAEREDYSGLHQWNLDHQDGRFVIWDSKQRIDVGDALANRATVISWVEGELVMVEILKRPAP